MTVRLSLNDADAERFSFGCSPGSEALRSLHVLTNVKRHPLHISWVLETRTRLSPELKAELEVFGFWCARRPLDLPEIWPPGAVGSWPDDLDALRKAPVECFAEPLIHAALSERGRAGRIPLSRFQADSDLRDRALAQVGAGHPPSSVIVRELIADPERVRDRFAGFLAAYWDACLAADWPGLEAHLHAEIADRFRSLARVGPVRMLAGLSGHITASDEVAHIRPPGARGNADPIEVTLSGQDRVLLVPSHFMWPELAVTVRHERDPVIGEAAATVRHDLGEPAAGDLAAIVRHERPEFTAGDLGRPRPGPRTAGGAVTVLIGYALAGMARQGKAPEPADDLLGLLRSAGDPTRLQILELLARRSRSTSELAGLIGLTEAAVSKHLKVLHRAGWLAAERHSYYVYYRLEPAARDRLVSGLDRTLSPS